MSGQSNRSRRDIVFLRKYRMSGLTSLLGDRPPLLCSVWARVFVVEAATDRTPHRRLPGSISWDVPTSQRSMPWIVRFKKRRKIPSPRSCRYENGFTVGLQGYIGSPKKIVSGRTLECVYGLWARSCILAAWGRIRKVNTGYMDRKDQAALLSRCLWIGISGNNLCLTLWKQSVLMCVQQDLFG